MNCSPKKDLSRILNGDAVYTARAIVGYKEFEVTPKSMEMPDGDSLKMEQIAIIVYPNPATDFLTVEILGNTEKTIKFVLTNTLGVKVLEKMLNVSNSIFKIDVHILKQGMYIYEALFDITGESIYKGRIIINR